MVLAHQFARSMFIVVVCCEFNLFFERRKVFGIGGQRQRHLSLLITRIASSDCGGQMWSEPADFGQEVVLHLGDCAFSVMKFDMSRVLSRYLWAGQVIWLGPVLGFVADVDEHRFRKGNFLPSSSASGQGPVSPGYECRRLCGRLPRTASPCCSSHILVDCISYTSLLRSVLRLAYLLILLLLGHSTDAWYLSFSHGQS
jgi:hypothetical protein